MNQKTLIAIIAVAIVIVGSIYYLSRNNYGGQNRKQPDTNHDTKAPQGSSQISIKNFAFNPAELSINKGATVIWINKDSTTHRISGNGFQSMDLTNSQSYGFIFNNSGTYDYICSIHPDMKGKVIVK